MDYTKAKMFRVRVYNIFSHNERRLTHSFRVAAESIEDAERKVANHTGAHITNVIARPAGHEEFWQ